MKTLDFNAKTLKNQQDVVKEEIRVNVKNQPYGGFMWIDISQQAFSKWENNHDGYGSFVDLESARLDDVRASKPMVPPLGQELIYHHLQQILLIQ